MPVKHARGMKIRGKIALGYVLILLMLGLFLMIVSSRITDLEQETVYLSTHDMQVHELSYQIEKNVLDMETGQRGYALTGIEDYLKPYNDGLVGWRINSAKLKELIADNPEQLRNLNNILGSIEDWINKAGQPVIDMKRRGQEEALGAFFLNDAGKSIVDLIRSQSDYFRSNERILTAERIANLKDSNHKLLVTIYILWGLVALLAALIVSLISGSIVKPLRSVIEAIGSIAGGGNLSERITVKSHDETYELAMATNRLLETVQLEQWGSEQVSLMSMSLQQQSDDLTELCRTFVNKLALILEVQYSAIYVLDGDDQYKRVSSYAGSEDREIHMGAEKIASGEGLLGQCAVDKRIRILEDLPADYISINSGLGRTAPRYIAIAPILFENKTVAVLEAASLTKWSPFHMKTLTELLAMMGVTLNSVTTRMEIQKLYGESQVMNEELQVQSEELQVQSEELQGYTKELLALNQALKKQKNAAEKAAVELERYNDELELSSRYKSEFLANMSHELRTPLNSMLILSQLLSENRNGTLNEEEQSYAAVIHSSGSELLSMINDILDLSKVEAGKMQVEMDAVNLTELPSMLRGYFDQTAEQKQLDFKIRLEDNVPDLFYSDEMRLHQILRNLLSNSFKFTEQGEVEVVIRRLEHYEDKDYAPEGPVLAFAVRDSGIGVSEQNRELIFEAFRQADGSTARKFGGTGLGLSISLQLARLLSGHITLESSVGHGSTFTLYLPCWEQIPELEESDKGHGDVTESRVEWLGRQEAAASEEAPASIRAVDVLLGKTVLIVDDDLRNIFALQKGLEPYGMSILTAQNGYECLQILRVQPDIDIILLDIMMPDLDGYDTLSIVREELQMTELPIIAISAKTMKEERERCLAVGASDFISKPVNLQEVVNRMCWWLQNRL